jgi:plasmid stabilization system protein ParE
MRGFVVQPDALADLNEIWEFIAVDNLAPRTVFWTKFTMRFAR